METDKTYISLKSELALIKALSKLYKEVEPENRLLITEMENYKGYISSDNIFMFVPKTERMKEIFNRFTDKTFKQMQNVPDLKYISSGNITTENTSKFNIKTLMLLMECFKNTFETLKISVMNNYPIKLENDHFIFILAPRIED